MVIPPECFGQPCAITEQYMDIPIPGSQWVYELVVTTVWVEEGLLERVPYRFRAWYLHWLNGYRIGPIQGFDIPAVELNAALGENTTDPPDGVVKDPMPPEPVETKESANESD